MFNIFLDKNKQKEFAGRFVLKGRDVKDGWMVTGKGVDPVLHKLPFRGCVALPHILSVQHSDAADGADPAS